MSEKGTGIYLTRKSIDTLEANVMAVINSQEAQTAVLVLQLKEARRALTEISQTIDGLNADNVGHIKDFVNATIAEVAQNGEGPKHCTWREYVDPDGTSWQSKCYPEGWYFEVDGPADSDMAYCPKCGKMLRIEKWVEEDDDDRDP